MVLVSNGQWTENLLLLCIWGYFIDSVYFTTKMLVVLQPLRWCCVDCVIHHERDVREEQHHTYMWCEQAITEWSWHVNSIVACCHDAKLCAHAARDFRTHQRQQISWSYCAASWTFGLVAWRNSNKKFSLSCNRLAARSIAVMLHVWYAIAFQFDSHLDDFPFVFFFFQNFPQCMLSC